MMKGYRIFITRILLLLPILASSMLQAQDPAYIDSLRNRLSMLSDTGKAKVLNELARQFRNHQPEQSVKYALEALEWAQKHDRIRQQLVAYNFIGVGYKKMSELDSAALYLEKGYTLSLESAEVRYQATLSSNLGNLWIDRGELKKALDYYFISLKAEDSLENKPGIAASYITIGAVYGELKDMDRALNYFEQALQMSVAIDHPYYQQFCYNNIGQIHVNKGGYATALPYFEQSLALSEKMGLTASIASSLNSIGVCYLEMGDNNKALETLKKSLDIKIRLNDMRGQAVAIGNLGDVYFNLKQYDKAFDHYGKALAMAKETNARILSKEIHQIIAEKSAIRKDFKEAYQHHLIYTSIKDSMINEATLKQVNELEAKYENEKKQREIELLNKDKALKESQLAKKDTQRNALIIGLLLLVSLVVVVLSGYQQKKQANKLLSKQKMEILAKNKSITDSIEYAKRIQNAILPPQALMREYLKEYFILYRPKDIVSGDFYWIDKIGNRIFLAMVDCTGHGVPGAFVSIVGYNGLNRCINEFSLTRPASVLDKLNELVEEAFHQQEKDPSVYDQDEVKDGMDIALCTIDLSKNILEFAGAHNPLYLVRKGALTEAEASTQPFTHKDHLLMEVEADRQPIGTWRQRKQFTNHRVELLKGDRIYLFTDGYIDQFGGPKGKKFFKKPFKELLLSIQDHSMQDQQKIINETLEQWKKGYEQIDDISVLGVEI